MELCNFCTALIWTIFRPKTLKLDWVAFHSLTFQLKCLDFQSKQYKKLAPVLSRFCNWLLLTHSRVSVECRKTQVVILANHKGRRQSGEPIKTQNT